MERYDVVVIGAGTPGWQCARRLEECGLRVLLVDRMEDFEAIAHLTKNFVRRSPRDFDLPEHLWGVPLRHVALYAPARRRAPRAERTDDFRRLPPRRIAAVPRQPERAFSASNTSNPLSVEQPK